MDDNSKEKRAHRRLLTRPAWIDKLESQIADAIPIHPNIISALKILIVAPILVLSLRQIAVIPASPVIILGLFVLFAALDYLDGTVARYRGLDTNFGRFFDRLTDFPILLALSYFCLPLIPKGLIAAKVGLDLVLMIIYLRGLGGTENRVRTAISYTTLITLLFVSQGWASKIITADFAVYLLASNIAFSAVVALYNLRIIQKRFLADALSAANLLCGVFSMVFASRHRFDLSLLFLMLGAAFDGFDGAAARKFGGTRWGVYSDDVADAVNYGIAPGVALHFVLGGIEGWIVGVFYGLFTISRLVFFTLNKKYTDPDYFSGVPSTIGALVVLCSILLFKNHSVILGMMVGIACVQMVSFDTHYRHLGRALSSNRRIIYGMPALVILVIAGRLYLYEDIAYAIILGASLVYGLVPTVGHFVRLIGSKKSDALDVYEQSEEADSALASKETGRGAIIVGKVVSRLGHLTIPLGAGVILGFYFADQEMRFLPTALEISLALFIFGFASVPLGRIIQGRAFVDTQAQKKVRKRVVAFSLLASLAVVLRLVLFWAQSPSYLTELSEDKFEVAFSIDSTRFKELDGNMERAATFVEGLDEVFGKKPAGVLTPDEEKDLLKAWQTLYNSAFALDQIRIFFEDWYRFDVSRIERSYLLRSFLLSFAAELSIFEKGARMVRAIEKNPHALKFLDAPHPEAGLDSHTFSIFKQELLGVRDESMVIAGKQYLNFLKTTLKGEEEAKALGVGWLWGSIERRLGSIEDMSIIDKTRMSASADLQAIQRATRRQWFSAQKSMAAWMGDTRFRRIGTYLVTPEQQEEMDTHLQPGDIMLSRKNWYLSNVGLPGFWPHAILYLGAPEKFENYFESEDVRALVEDLSGEKISFVDYIKRTWPAKWDEYVRGDHGEPFRVIEAVSEGVIFNTLAHASGDYVAAIRPRLSKKAKAQAVLEAFGHEGKPYDFDFDFATDDTLVCTELVWRSYRPSQGKDGVDFPLVNIMGRFTLPANEIARAYAQDRARPDSKFEFVYFLDANEKEQKAFVSTEEAFAKTHARTKWDVALP